MAHVAMNGKRVTHVAMESEGVVHVSVEGNGDGVAPVTRESEAVVTAEAGGAFDEGEGGPIKG